MIALPFGPCVDKRVRADLRKSAAPKDSLEMLEEFNAGPYHYGVLFEKL